MSTIRGTIRGGRVVFETSPDWPEGTEVNVNLAYSSEETIGISEESQGNDPDSLARWLAWFDSLEPLILTAEDEERIQKARAEQKAFELATWEERSRKLEKLFE